MHAFKNLTKICKNICIQNETNESLFNDSYSFLKFHMIGESKKNMLFIFCTASNKCNLWQYKFDSCLILKAV